MLEALQSRARTPEKVAEIEAELAQSPMPEGGAYLWGAFRRLHGRRGSTGYGPAPLTCGDFDAFSRLSGLRLTPCEIEVIEALDQVAMAAAAERMKA